MTMTYVTAVEVLDNTKIYSDLYILESLHTAKIYVAEKDIVYFINLLDHSDSGIVTNALYALVHIYRVECATDLLLAFSKRDPHDHMEMPIQSQALRSLYRTAKEDPRTIEAFKQVAFDPKSADSPRKLACAYLAEIYGVPWHEEYDHAMIWDAEGELSSSVRRQIQEAIKAKENSQGLVLDPPQS